jgi:hypothetical protein
MALGAFCVKRVLLAAALLATASLSACDQSSSGGGQAPQTAPSSAAGGGPLSAPTPHWAPYAEPTEHAFSLELPQGWTAQAGLKRLPTGEIRPWLRAVSGAGDAEVFIGDPDVPDFSPPTPALLAAGLNEGAVYKPGEGRALTVAPYRTGAEFAAQWGAGHVEITCEKVEPAGAESLPEASGSLLAAYASQSPVPAVEAGEAKFHCLYRGQPARAYVFAATGKLTAAPLMVWDARAVAGYIAQSGHESEAKLALTHALSTFVVDSDWLKKQPAWSGDRMRPLPAVAPIVAAAADKSGN